MNGIVKGRTAPDVLTWWRSGSMSLDWLRDQLPQVWSKDRQKVSHAEALELWQAAAAQGTLIPDRGLPDGAVLTIYRSQRQSDDLIGVSWLLSETIALFHGALSNDEDRRATVILTGQVDRRDVLAYLSSRPGGCHESAGCDQREVIVDPATVKILTRQPLRVGPADRLDLFFRARAENAQPLGIGEQMLLKLFRHRFEEELVPRPSGVASTGRL